MTAITKDSIEQAYCFFHQKLQVYAHSSSPTQKDEIEYALSSYVESMNKDLYTAISKGNAAYLTNHNSFAEDLSSAVEQLEKMCPK